MLIFTEFATAYLNFMSRFLNNQCQQCQVVVRLSWALITIQMLI